MHTLGGAGNHTGGRHKMVVLKQRRRVTKKITQVSDGPEIARMGLVEDSDDGWLQNVPVLPVYNPSTSNSRETLRAAINNPTRQ